ncbi:class I SAM-dependent methyltransferase [Falsiroseomonas sp.]|uniref:class I SAM-dependent methyltransferase n=1 Tax=Falsiroseomonas sp. TaxID=2870721 RepID=UPI00356385DB
MAEDAATIAAQQREFWNSPATRVWADEHDRIDSVLAGVLPHLLDAAAPQPGERVLDVGCGSGTTVLAFAERVGPAGRVLGADIAEASVAVANRRIADSDQAQAGVILADAATHAFEPRSFDVLTSRFGVMFFADPVAAFANLRGALSPGGRVALAAFRSPAENPWASAPLAAIRHLVAPPPTEPEAPGQFAFADPARVQRILAGAGFRDVGLTQADPVMRLGENAEAAAEAAMTLGPARRALNAANAPPELWEQVRDTLRAFFRDHEGPNGVSLRGGIWLITACP